MFITTICNDVSEGKSFTVLIPNISLNHPLIIWHKRLRIIFHNQLSEILKWLWINKSLFPKNNSVINMKVMGNCAEHQHHERVHKHNKYWLTWLRQVELTFWVHLNGDRDMKYVHSEYYISIRMPWCKCGQRMSNTNTQSMSSSFHFHRLLSCPDPGMLEPPT